MTAKTLDQTREDSELGRGVKLGLQMAANACRLKAAKYRELPGDGWKVTEGKILGCDLCADAIENLLQEAAK